MDRGPSSPKDPPGYFELPLYEPWETKTLKGSAAILFVSIAFLVAYLVTLGGGADYQETTCLVVASSSSAVTSSSGGAAAFAAFWTLQYSVAASGGNSRVTVSTSRSKTFFGTREGAAREQARFERNNSYQCWYKKDSPADVSLYDPLSSLVTWTLIASIACAVVAIAAFLYLLRHRRWVRGASVEQSRDDRRKRRAAKKRQKAAADLRAALHESRGEGASGQQERHGAEGAADGAVRVDQVEGHGSAAAAAARDDPELGLSQMAGGRNARIIIERQRERLGEGATPGATQGTVTVGEMHRATATPSAHGPIPPSAGGSGGEGAF